MGAAATVIALRNAGLFSLEALEDRRLLATFPLTALPALSSNPTASAQLYLDFDGDPASTWFFHSVPQTPAYSRDADPNTFSDAELAAIQQIWRHVAEKYSPFNINVTTVNPGNLDDLKTLRIVIGGNGDWAGPGLAGIAQSGGFSSANLPNTVYVFPDRLSSGDPTMVADVGTHEAGHALSLVHTSSNGNAQVGPIMGTTLASLRRVWWNGMTPVGVNQDDLAVLSGSTNAFGYRSDDHGNAIAAATALSISANTATGAGVITQTSDRDYFSFSTSGGSVSISAAVAQYGAMLDLKLELRNSAGALVTSADTASLGENITATLSAGTYYVVVASHGSYGDIGQYSLSATLPSGTPSVINRNWIGPASGGIWSDASSWSPAGVPDADDRVTIADASVTLFSDVTIGALTITGAGSLDVRGHALVIDYADVGPLELWDGTGYTGMSGLIARGALRSTLAEISTLLAAVEAADALAVPTTATATWAGQTVDGSSVLVKLSIGGDSNLDGAVNIDDYGRIDAAVQSALAGLGWFDGDFNFDGRINIDDYGIIDFNQSL